MKHLILLFAFVVFSASLCGFMPSAQAQTDALPVAAVRPDDWQNAESGASDEASAQWVDPKTESRIEVRSVRIVRDQHAAAFREAFDAQLAAGNFKRVSDAKERTIPLVNAEKRTGYWTEYEYAGADVPISVVTFEFAVSGMAIYVIGYFARPNRSEGVEALVHAISQMVDKN